MDPHISQTRRQQRPLRSYAWLPRAAMVACLTAAFPLASCEKSPGTPGSPVAVTATWPDGTVLAVGGEPISGAEVDRYVEMVHVIEPHLVKQDHRRKALANVVLPIAVGRALVPKVDRDAAFREAQRLLSEARETGTLPEGAVEAQYLTGTWKEIGMTIWNEAQSTAPDSFTAVIETPGAWTFAKVLATNAVPGEPFGPLTQVTVQRYDVYYYDREGMRNLIEDGLKELPFEVIDPEWEAVIPPLYLYPRTKKP